ncbi:Uncharacterized protein PCOAH_00037420 [Plasmodium coatneyi]|uniref:Pv-fam-d protein n=1 Tax=Plasmodium coatneyi TaxID=208452 RepID=A0A1B1E4L2_9APIC|nr:Uncharacterized protein PCOAH_00037420 [Plasmodium coatneyi]ANQ09948.1 Uncharacterized protein PCOAH_00037420 [Plasmodium coatneyi]
MYRILYAKIFLLTFSAWILRASDNEKGLSYNGNNGERNAQNDLELKVPRLLSVNDLDSELDFGSLESLASENERQERYERPEELDLRAFGLENDEELDPNLESFKEYIKHVARSDKSLQEKYEDTKDYIKNMDPMTRKKIRREIKDKLNESRRMKRRRRCSKMHGRCRDMYRDLQYNDYRMMSQIRKMEKRMSGRSFSAGALTAFLAIILLPVELLCCSTVLFLMGVSLIFLLLKKF